MGVGMGVNGSHCGGGSRTGHLDGGDWEGSMCKHVGFEMPRVM
jgi:hypothetical protein